MQKIYKILLFISVTLLIIIGIIMIYSSSHIWAEYKYNDPYKYMKQQLIFAIIGFVLMYFISKINIDYYYKKTNLILGFCLFLLVLVLIPGIGNVRNGSRSWFSIFGLGFQPSEVAKIGMIIFSAKYLSKLKKVSLKSILPLLGVLILVFGLIMLQPDFGTGMVLIMTIISLIFISGLDFKYFYYMFGLGVAGITILILIAPYRLERITSFINPWKDSLGSGFQIIQSLYAIGPGGLLGQGFLNSRQKQFYLPEPQTDFIFSIICEEFGFIGSTIIIILFFIICYCGLKLALKEENLFKKYLIFGLIFQILFQAVLNLMVVVGLIPVTGVTLPFLSYGGSSLLVSMASIGIILNISKNSN